MLDIAIAIFNLKNRFKKRLPFLLIVHENWWNFLELIELVWKLVVKYLNEITEFFEKLYRSKCKRQYLILLKFVCC